ncbi:hypothetical protein EU803_10730 [Loktanella sp. IMCC34160]|uniref:hypothetical protein n=1 Tax=Loktanella sp. IMCC34160 TaxID=2510646 RepID=UPI00101B7385|nr:hypothetical protein [Loktanella sp. IMCC34160]RYG91553.1 hypothetical protein EU803_10730 [Loktanella sp. IMCC34160]
MRKTLLILPVLGILAACATPREACINDARRHVVLLDQQIAVTQGNISRGYALATVQDVQVVTEVCRGTNEDGSTFSFPCQKTRVVDRQEPVAINVAEERAKLADLQARRAAAERTAQATIQQCVATHPE